MYEKRNYRDSFNQQLVWFNICIGETDLMIGCNTNLEETALRLVRKQRGIITRFISEHPEFLTSLVPLEYDYTQGIIKDMLDAGNKTNTGPMAAVAGAIAMHTGRGLRGYSQEVFVENGGDIYIDSQNDRSIGIYAGNSPLSGKFRLKIGKDMFPVGICTSSGTVGHSLSFGKADAVTVIAEDAALSDAAATAACNMIKDEAGIAKALEWVASLSGIIGAVAIMNDKMGAVGDIELAPWE
jgi:uncharacterized protein